MEKSLTQLVEEIAQIRRAEQSVEARIAKVDYTICNLRTKKYQIHQELRRLRDSRHELAREYHAIKSPCNNLLREAEKELGRKLTLDEIQRTEIFYNEKAAKRSAHISR